MGYEYTNTNRLQILGISVFTIFITPLFAFASVSITEIMYDPKDADTGREWVEVLNVGSDVDILAWKFSEGGTNHSLAVTQGSSVLKNGDYAIIADNTQKFFVDFPEYSGILFDSSFSLKNTSEQILLKDKSLNVIDSVTYDSSWGGAGDGNSLQKTADGKFAGFLPTPGAGVTQGISATSLTESSSTSTSTPPLSESSASSSAWPTEAQIFANAGTDRGIIVGANSVFEGKALGFQKQPIDNARFIWNFGDGTTKEGKSVMHVYKYPGEYIVILDVSSGYFSASDRVMIRAEKSKIIISSLGDGDGKNNFIELSNPSNYDADISGWILRGGTTTFILPAHTYIGGNKKLIFASDTTKIVPQKGERVELLYPNGIFATFYQPSESPKALNQVVSSNSNRVVISTVAENSVKSEDIVTEQSALALNPIAKNRPLPHYKWLLGVAAVALVSIIGVSLIPKVKNENILRASDFKIIEEE